MKYFIQIVSIFILNWTIQVNESIAQIDSLNYKLKAIQQGQVSQEKSIQQLYSILENVQRLPGKQYNDITISTLSELSNRFRNFGLYYYALEYNQQALKVASTYDDQFRLSKLNQQKGDIYLILSEFQNEKRSFIDSAENSYKTALSVLADKKSLEDISPLYNSLSATYIELKDFQQAKEYSRLAEKEAKLWSNKQMEITSSYLLSKIYLKLADYHQSIKESKFQLSQPEIENYQKLKMEFYNNLYIAYNEIDRSKLAIESLNNFLEIQDQVTKEVNLDNSADINEKYKAEQLRNKNLAYQVQANITRSKETKANLINIILVTSLILFLIVGITYLVKERYKQQNLRMKLVQKVQQFEIESINSLVDGREMERKDIGRFLHDDVSALVNSANIHLEVLASEKEIHDNPLLLKTQSILDEIAEKVRSLSHQLLNDVLQKYGLEVSLEELTKRLDTTKIKFGLVSTIPADQRYNVIVENKIYGIVQELVNNILKHSQASYAKVILSQSSNNLIVEVVDDGVGFSNDDIIKGGVGLNQIRTRVKSMGGNLKINSNNGAEIKIKIPLLVALNQPAKPTLVT